MKKYDVPNKGFTHGGNFHSDDVFATALLKYMNKDIEIIRGFKVPDDFDGIVYDIGFGEFDHHQADRRVRENGNPYAAFGLLWDRYGSEIVGEEEAKRFDEKFIEPLDLSDNTGCDNQIAKIISYYNPSWNEEKDFDGRFLEAVDFAYNILTRYFHNVESTMLAKSMVEEAISKSDGDILILEQSAPWKKFVKGTDIKFVVYPSLRGGYSAQCVDDDETEQMKVPFKKEWRGLEIEELREISKIPTLRFCHNSGFLIAADTKEDAILACKKTLSEQ